MIDEAYFRDRFDTPAVDAHVQAQQRDGAFWDRASAKGRYDRHPRSRAFFIGGWYDGYRDSIPRMLEQREGAGQGDHRPVVTRVAARAVSRSPAWNGGARPCAGSTSGCKGVDTGILEEPRFAVYVRDWHPPGPYLEEAPGHWRYEDGWPIARIREQPLYLQPDHTLREAAPPATTHQLRYMPSIGFEAGGPVMWWGDVAHDQRGTRCLQPRLRQRAAHGRHWRSSACRAP